MNHKLVKQTHEPVSLLKIPGRTTAHAPRVFLDVSVGLGENIPDFVNARLQFSVLEDGRGFVGRVLGHGDRVSTTTWGTRVSRDASFIHPPHFCLYGIAGVRRAFSMNLTSTNNPVTI